MAKSTDLVYEGIVDIKIKVNGKSYSATTKNAGTDYLKQTFAKAMLGDLQEEDIPGYMAIEKYDAENDMYIKYTLRDLPISGKQITGYNSTQATFTTYVASSELMDTVQSDSPDLFRIVLKSNRNKDGASNLLAYTPVSPVMLAYITPGTTATISWSIRILNKDEV